MTLFVAPSKVSSNVSVIVDDFPETVPAIDAVGPGVKPPAKFEMSNPTEAVATTVTFCQNVTVTDPFDVLSPSFNDPVIFTRAIPISIV